MLNFLIWKNIVFCAFLKLNINFLHITKISLKVNFIIFSKLFRDFHKLSKLTFPCTLKNKTIKKFTLLETAHNPDTAGGIKRSSFGKPKNEFRKFKKA